MIYLVSDCLLGQNCKYNGGNNYNEKVISFCEQAKTAGHTVLPVCPELMGGLAAPRPANEIIGGTGQEVLRGIARVVNAQGQDATAAFVVGAQKVLALAEREQKQHPGQEVSAILKAKSPSCGCGTIYDGSFSHTVQSGDGVTSALLKEHRIPVMTEESL